MSKGFSNTVIMAIFDLPINERWVVILCGGRGSRLAPITNTIPKSLIKIHEKPILWYVFLTLFKYGFRRFIFPLGYKGEMIEEFITREFKDRECKLMFFDTGVDTPIAQRLEKVKNTILSDADLRTAQKVSELKQQQGEISILPFTKDKWSSCDI